MAIATLITESGVSAATAAHVSGVKAVISEIAVGTGLYEAGELDGSETALKTEVARFPIADFANTGVSQIKVSGYWQNTTVDVGITEIGAFLSTGELFAIFERSNPYILFKTPQVEDLIVGLTFDLAGLPVESISVIDPGNDITMLNDVVWLEQNTLAMRLLAESIRSRSDILVLQSQLQDLQAQIAPLVAA